MKHFIFLAAILTTCAGAQTFDVASVRVDQAGTAGGEKQGGESITSTPGSLILHNMTLRSCVKWAWDVRDFQVSGGPDWMSFERYDISAKAANQADESSQRKMLRALLADRFHLVVREERKQLPVYALVVVRAKAGLKTASDNEPASMRPRDGALDFRNVSMADFAERLSTRPLAVDRPVLDKTGLSGGFDFSLKLADSVDHLKAAVEEVDRGNGVSLFDVIRQQLGLRLAPQKAELPAVVVVSAARNPGEN